MTEFFPLDVLDEKFQEMTEQHATRLAFLSGYIRNENLANLFLAVAEEQEAKEKVRSRAYKLDNELFLSHQNHQADLNWAVGELKSVLAHWSDTYEISVAANKERLQNLVSALNERANDI